METLSFPRYNVAEIVTHVRNKILTGADGKNLSKSDLYPNPKVRGEVWAPRGGRGASVAPQTQAPAARLRAGQALSCSGPAPAPE